MRGVVGPYAFANQGLTAGVCLGRQTGHSLFTRRTLSYRKTRRCAAECSKDFAASLKECEDAGDAFGAMEILTEARVTQVDVGQDAFECGVRAIATGGNWQKSSQLLESAIEKNWEPAPDTIDVVFRALAIRGEAEAARKLLGVLDGLQNKSLALMHNWVIKAYAKKNDVDTACTFLDDMRLREDIDVEYNTLPNIDYGKEFTTVHNYDAVVSACLRCGDGDRAADILEMRDYL